MQSVRTECDLLEPASTLRPTNSVWNFSPLFRFGSHIVLRASCVARWTVISVV